MEKIENLDIKKSNIKIYPIYKMLSWDLLFYYAIIFIFLTQVKNISASQVLLAEAFYPFFKFIFHIPCTSLVDKIGKRNSLIIANIFITLQSLLYIFAANFNWIILANLFCAIGYVVKGMCETNVLYDSLSGFEDRPALFAKIDGKSTSLYYYANAISSIASGFLYVINGYLPMILCFIICMVSVILSFKFKEIHQVTFKRSSLHETKNYFKNLTKSFKYIFKSPRLRCLIFFYSIVSAIFSINNTFTSSMLTDLNIPEQYFGVILCVLNLIAAVSSKKQEWFHDNFKNRTLTVIAMPTIISFIIIGFIANSSFSFNVIFVIIFIMFAIQRLLFGPFHTLNRKYLNNFTNTISRTKVISLATLIESLTRIFICLFASSLIDTTGTSYTYIIVGCVLTLILTLLLDAMRSKVGLQPDQYKNSEIDFLQMN